MRFAVPDGWRAITQELFDYASAVCAVKQWIYCFSGNTALKCFFTKNPVKLYFLDCTE
jgi:hypothetical protein